MTSVKCPKCEFVNPTGVPACLRCKTPLPRVKVQGRAAPPVPSLFRQGQVVANRYSVISMIGRGGMGCIYRVRDNVLKEDVALKTLLPQHARDKMVVERFFNEAKIARGLSHPNIVRVHDIGMTRAEEGNIIYISMELVDGQSLRGMLEGLLPGERLPVKQALMLVDQLCEALEYAHHHTVHRDIKPENVMVSGDNVVKLMDFGISKLMDTTGLTDTSVVMGTPFYMSPEQLRNSANVDVRTDIYSVGVMLYEILTGNMPTGVPKPASQLTREVPPTLDPIVAKCVEPDPADRYQSVAELRTDIRQVLAVIEGTRPARLPRAKRARRAGTSAATLRKAAGYGLILVIAAITAAGLYHFEQKRRQLVAGGVMTAGVSEGTQSGFDAEYARLSELRTRARAAAAARPHDATERLLADADARWKQVEVESAQKSARALDLAVQALQCYIAPLVWRPEMVFVPPGKATVTDGTTTEVIDVSGFLMDQAEVTNGMFLQFCRELERPHRDPAAETAPDLPVTNVTFYDAQAYAAWAKKALPTEAQWVRAAQGDQAGLAYPWGNMWAEGACNSAGVAGEDVFEGAGVVRQLPQDLTAVGCYDMAGNAAEWTRTVCGPLNDTPAPQRDDARGLTFGVYAVVRGGHFEDVNQSPLSARMPVLFENSYPWLGFRCALEIPDSAQEIEQFLR